jgi:hypothetical protein
MTHRGLVEKMLWSLGEYVGQPSLGLDSSGSVVASIDGFWFGFNYNERDDCLFVRVFAGDLKKSLNPEEVLEGALRANFDWSGPPGGVLGLKDDSLSLACRLDFPFPEEEEGGSVPEDFLVYFLPRLSGAAAVSLCLCGEDVP